MIELHFETVFFDQTFINEVKVTGRFKKQETIPARTIKRKEIIAIIPKVTIILKLFIIKRELNVKEMLIPIFFDCLQTDYCRF